MSNFYLSFSDLLLVDGFAEEYGKGGSEAIVKFLHASGMDITKPIEESVVNHRNLRQEAVTCIRYCGTERTDVRWIKSGAASLEATIASSKDSYLRSQLRGMSKEIPMDKAFQGPFYEDLD